MTGRLVYSVGHSTRSIAEFFDLLSSHGIECLVDVRRFPVSRRHPQFGQAALSRSLEEVGIHYVHLGGPLGGFRDGGYEDYVRTEAFREGLEALDHWASRKLSAFMCAEKNPWACHRRFIAEALGSRGDRVLHLLDRERVWDPEDALLPPSKI